MPIKRQTHIIDATGRPLGRLAVEVAALLRGKHKVDFVPYKDMGDFVVIKNIDKIKLTGNKLEQKEYYRHSGYLGGLKTLPLKKIFQKNPLDVLRRATKGMLPKNRLSPGMLKRLKAERL